MNIVSGNASDANAVTTHDTNPINPMPIAIYAAGAGTLVCVTRSDYEKGLRDGVAVASMPTVTITVVAGGTINLQVAIIKTASTATGIIGLLP